MTGFADKKRPKRATAVGSAPDAPYIKRTVDGREYTVKIHFHPDSHETAKEKLKRIMVNDIQSGVLEDEILKNS